MGKVSGSFFVRRRGEILRIVFKFLDFSDLRLFLRFGRLILSVSINFFILFVLWLKVGVCFDVYIKIVFGNFGFYIKVIKSFEI